MSYDALDELIKRALRHAVRRSSPTGPAVPSITITELEAIADALSKEGTS